MSDESAQAASAAARRLQLAHAGAELGLSDVGAALDKLLAYITLLQRWNRIYNLTALRDPDEMLSHHLVDCMAVMPALRRHAGERELRVLDVGSGGGLPGVVVAIFQPKWQVSCVDSVAKKASFIRQVSAELGLQNLRAVHARVETMPAVRAFDLVTSRAFASLADMTALTAHLLAEAGVWVAMKGNPSPDEFGALPPAVDMFHVEPLHVPGLTAKRCLVWMRPRPI